MPAELRNKLIAWVLGPVALVVGVPGTALYLPASLFILVGAVVEMFDPLSGISVAASGLCLGFIGLAGVLSYWAALVFVFEGKITKLIKAMVLVALVAGIVLAMLFLFSLGTSGSIFFVPVILAGTLNAIALYFVPIAGPQNNKSLNTDAGKAGAG